MYHINKKPEFLGSISVTDIMDLASVNLTQLALKATTLGEMTQYDDHCVVKGHSRSLLSVPISEQY